MAKLQSNRTASAVTILIRRGGTKQHPYCKAEVQPPKETSKKETASRAEETSLQDG